MSVANQVLVAKESDLPEGWEYTSLGDTLEVKYGKGLKEADRLEGNVPVYGSNGVVGRHNIALTKGPTIIVGRKGTIGAVHYSLSPCWPIDTTYFIDDFKGLEKQFVVYALRLLALSELDTSTAIPGLNRDDLYSQSFPLPPLAEQKRIVKKAEQLLALTDAARKRLARVPPILKRFRQAVLAAACSGRLTADWRNDHLFCTSAKELLQSILSRRRERVKEQGISKYTEAKQPDESECPEVPEEWAISSFDQLTCLVTSGSRGWAKYYADSGPLFVRAQDINTDHLKLDEMAHVKPPDSAEGMRTRVQRHDLLVTITGANVTKSALVDEPLGEAYVSQHVAPVRPVDLRVAQFLYLWVISPLHGRAKLLSDAYGAGKPGLNLDNIKEIVVALPPLEEQQEIVRRVEALFQLADAIENRITSATAGAGKLTQAILSKAFRGELVPTEAELARRENRSYEPASALLARIHAASSNNGTPSRKGKRRAK